MHIKLSKIEKSKDLVEYVDCLEAEKEIEEPIPKTNEGIMNKLLKSNKQKQEEEEREKPLGESMNKIVGHVIGPDEYI